ncbi:MAG: hypothetical protein ACR2J6_06725, partial [Thermoleophilaceae bacterium]
INSTVRAIRSNALAINGTVNSINGSVVSINRRVNSINSSANSINSRARSIFRGVGPVGATDQSSIKASVGRILRSFKSIDPETKSINGGVAGINGRAARGITRVRTLKDDFGPISVFVGSGQLGAPGNSTAGPGTIHGHANSINCSQLINLAGPTDYCNQ